MFFIGVNYWSNNNSSDENNNKIPVIHFFFAVVAFQLSVGVFQAVSLVSLFISQWVDLSQWKTIQWVLNRNKLPGYLNSPAVYQKNFTYFWNHG